jgi:hypothetical protein
VTEEKIAGGYSYGEARRRALAESSGMEQMKQAFGLLCVGIGPFWRELGIEEDINARLIDEPLIDTVSLMRSRDALAGRATQPGHL